MINSSSLLYPIRIFILVQVFVLGTFINDFPKRKSNKETPRKCHDEGENGKD